MLGGQIQKYKYTNTQIHKYSLVRFADRHNKCYIFEKEMVRGPQKQCSHVSDMQIHNTNTQIHKYKYTNTVWVKFADTSNMCYIFGKGNGTRTPKTMFLSVYNHLWEICLIKQAKITWFGRAEWKLAKNAIYKNANLACP